MSTAARFPAPLASRPRPRLRRPATSLLLAALAVSAGCGGELYAPPRVAVVHVTPSPVSLAAADSLRLAAEPRDDGGRPITGRTVVWQVRDTAVGRVTADGVLHARRVGETVVTATVDGVIGEATVTVRVTADYPADKPTERLLVEGTVSPASEDIPLTTNRRIHLRK